MPNKYKYSVVNDHGIIINRPASMNGNRGAYYPTVIETKNITGWQAPYDFACYFSTDHAGDELPNGGVWLYLSNDPTQPWTSYDDAVAAGHFDYIANKPASNPIYDASDSTAEGDQMETPHARVINGVVYMTTHQSGGPFNQTTSMNKSLDGINFTWVHYAAVIDKSVYMGDGHTGYAKWDINILPGVPFTYVGYTIAGGQTTSYFGQWGFNDPEEPWTLIKQYKRDSGRVFDGIEGRPNSPQLVFRLNPSLFIPQDDGSVIAIATTKSQGSSGSMLAVESSVQVQLDSEGIVPISKVDYFIDKPVSSPNYQELTDTLEYDGKKYMIYRGVGEGNSSTAIAHVGIIEYEVVGGSLELLDPPKPQYDNKNFIGVSSLPAGVSRLTGEGNLAFTSNGLELTIPAGASDGFYLPDVDDSLKIADIAWLNMRQAGNIPWTPHIGFVHNYIRGSALSLPDRIECALNPDANRMMLATYIDDVYTKLKAYDYDPMGDGPSSATPLATTYGCRWFPQETKAGLTTSMIERGFPELGAMPSGRYTPFIEIENKGTEALTVIIEGINYGTAGNFNYNWSLASKPTGSTATISDISAKNFDFTPDAEGVYQFSLTASDADNQSAVTTRSLSVSTENQPPVANAGPDQSVAAATQFTLDGTGSQDTDGTIVEWRWTQTAGDTVTLDLENPSSPRAISPSKTTPQTLTFSLVTVDDEGAVSSPSLVNIDVAAVVQNDVLNIIDKISFTFESDGMITAFPGRANRETFRLKPSDPTGLVLEDGWFDFEANDVRRVEISMLETTGVKIISSDTDSITRERSKLHVRMGDMPIKSSTKEFEPTVSVFVSDDERGVVMTAPGLSGAPKVKYYSTTARAV